MHRNNITEEKHRNKYKNDSSDSLAAFKCYSYHICLCAFCITQASLLQNMEKIIMFWLFSVVYTISCECSLGYIDQIKRAFTLHVKEHKSLYQSSVSYK